MSPEELYSIYLNNPIICTDTRSIQKGSIFFALKGPNFNGNSFAEAAIEQGAAYAVIDEPKFRKDDRYILVEHGLKALQELANYHRRQLKIPFLAITGSNGKTTTKELIRAVLSKKFKTLATKGNLNNHIGVPLTILSIDKSIEFAVIEMGANHQGEIESYCHIAEPDYGLITNVGKAHLEGFGGLSGVKKGKRELYHWLDENGIKIFINGDNGDLGEMASQIDPRKLVFYGTNSAFDTFAVLKKSQPELVISWKSGLQQGQHTCRLIGAYNFENVVAAVAVGNYFGVEAHLIDLAISSYMPDNSRSQRLQKGSNSIILDAYNANPSSMEAAIKNFSQLSDKNKVICIGDMAELGEDSEKEHKRILQLLKDVSYQQLILVGKNFNKFSNELDCMSFENAELASDWIKKNPLKSKTILIKGSRSTKMETILEAIQD
ncbi:MAG: UDP-N-acetylmuramoyl-tripeptide--D-alanyl-D-alanine ligase [Bacteroidetes bacterium]|nr:MAG: UDP-N-acetylmuramoyl-tripeptide--D-alanyl-D-alanine ligase [Bacteroidota bacterium]